VHGRAGLGKVSYLWVRICESYGGKDGKDAYDETRCALLPSYRSPGLDPDPKGLGSLLVKFSTVRRSDVRHWETDSKQIKPCAVRANVSTLIFNTRLDAVRGLD
jgi:hypothetical protein